MLAVARSGSRRGFSARIGRVEPWRGGVQLGGASRWGYSFWMGCGVADGKIGHVCQGALERTFGAVATFAWYYQQRPLRDPHFEATTRDKMPQNEYIERWTKQYVHLHFHVAPWFCYTAHFHHTDPSTGTASASIMMSASASASRVKATMAQRRRKTTAVCAPNCTPRSAARRRFR
jgi:hypothetical protein